MQRSYHLVRETAKYHDVTMLAFEQKDLFEIHFDDRDEALRACREGLSFCKELQFFDIPCDQIPFGKPLLAAASTLGRNPYTINWLRSSHFAQAVARISAEQDFDVVHFDTISLVPYLQQIGAVPATLDHHNVESQMMLRRAEIEPRKLMQYYFGLEGRKLRDYELRQCGDFAVNMMCSRLDQQRLEAICPEAKCVVIPNGVDTDFFTPRNAGPKQTTLVFAGRLGAYTNAQAACFIAREIWPAVKRIMPDATMDLVGHNPPAEVRELAKSDPSFRAPGFVDDVRDYIAAASIYVCPLFDGGGTKLKILDAMAMGKAIVASRVACEGIDLEDGSSVVFAETGDEFATAIKRLIQDDDLIATLGNNARRLAVDKYSYGSIGQHLASVFESLQRSR